MCAVVSFIAILGTSIGALFGQSLLALIFGTIVLATTSFVEHYHYRSRFTSAGLSDVYRSFTLANVGTSFVAAAAAFGMGSAVRLIALI